jgi:hypothetical protein
MIPWFIACAALVMFMGMLLVSASRAAKRDEQIEQYAAMYRAARWLSQWNYSRLAALQEVLSVKLGITFKAAQRMVDHEVATRPWYYTGQTLPLDLVPLELRSAAKAYNASVFKDWPDRYAEPRAGCVESAERIQLRALEEALIVMTQTPSDVVLSDIASSTGASFAVTEAVALAIRSRALYDINRLTQPDAEEVLPSVY